MISPELLLLIFGHLQASLPTRKWESQMAIFRVQLADDEKKLKTDLKALNEDLARALPPSGSTALAGTS